MDKITTRKELIERLEDVRAVEIKARDNYEEDIHIFSNPEIKDTIQKIKVDEDKHISILDFLIKMLKQ